MAHHRRRQDHRRDGSRWIRRQGRGCHFPIWAVLPELLEEETERRQDHELEQMAEPEVRQ